MTAPAGPQKPLRVWRNYGWRWRCRLCSPARGCAGSGFTSQRTAMAAAVAHLAECPKLPQDGAS